MLIEVNKKEIQKQKEQNLFLLAELLYKNYTTKAITLYLSSVLSAHPFYPKNLLFLIRPHPLLLYKSFIYSKTIHHLQLSFLFLSHYKSIVICLQQLCFYIAIALLLHTKSNVFLFLFQHFHNFISPFLSYNTHSLTLVIFSRYFANII